MNPNIFTSTYRVKWLKSKLTQKVKINIDENNLNQVFSLYFTFEFLHLLNLTEGQYCQRFDAFDSFCKELLLLFIAFGPPTKDTKKLTDNLWREIFSRGQKKSEMTTRT